MSLHKILEELKGESDEMTETSDNEKLDLAHQQILALIPKKMLIDTYVEFGCEPPYDPYAEEKGFNKAIDDMTHRLEGV